MIMIVFVLRTKPSGLYRHRRGLGLNRVGYREGNLHIRISRLAFHAKESPTRTREEVFCLVSLYPNSLTHVYSPAVRGPLNPGLPQYPLNEASMTMSPTHRLSSALQGGLLLWILQNSLRTRKMCPALQNKYHTQPQRV